MRYKLWYKIVKWFITHSNAGMKYVMEQRNEVAQFYEKLLNEEE